MDSCNSTSFRIALTRGVLDFRIGLKRVPDCHGIELGGDDIPESPSTTLAGTVDEILPSSLPSQPEKAQIGVYEADSGYSDLRIENTFTDEHGDDVRLKKGAHVEITFTAKDLDHN